MELVSTVERWLAGFSSGEVIGIVVCAAIGLVIWTLVLVRREWIDIISK